MVKTEVLKHPKKSFLVLVIGFIIIYIIIMVMINMANKLVNLGASQLIGQLIALYLYLMYMLRHQLQYYEYTIVDGCFIIKEYLSKREKTLLIVETSNIISINAQQKNKRSFYNKIKKIEKKHIVGTQMYYIEYDDHVDISLLKLVCSEAFIKELIKETKLPSLDRDE